MTEDEQRVQVLLKEYDTVRAEALARIRSRFEVLGASVVLGGLLLNHQGTWYPWQRLGAALLALAAASIYLYLHRAVVRCHRAIVGLEERINTLHRGEQLLTWETSLDGSFFNSRFGKPRR